MNANENKADIVIVEDDAIIAADLEYRLDRIGYRVCGNFSSGEKAIDFIEKSRPDLVIMDIVLKGRMTGIEAAEVIRESWGVPVIFLTAHSDADRLEQAKLALPFGYVLKPFHDRDLKITLEMALYAAKTETARRKSDGALRESEERFRQIYEHMAVGVARVSLEFRIESANEAYCLMLGYSEKELIGKHLKDFTHPESIAENLRKQSRLAAGEIDHFRLEKQFIHKSGRVIYGILDANLVRDAEGRPTYFLGSVLDITEFKRAEEALRKSEEKHRTLYETMAQGVVYQDADGGIISANPAAERILGLTSEQMKGRTSFDHRWHAIMEDGSEFPGEIHPAIRALRTGREIRNKIMGVFNPRTDEYRWISINAMPQFKSGQDAPYQVYTTFADITERVKAEEALALQRAQLIKAQKMEAIGTLAGGIAHDFNNLLQAINGYAQILLHDKSADDPDVSCLKAIHKSGERAAQLVRQLLLFSRKASTERKNIDLNREVERIKSILERTFPKTSAMEMVLDGRLWKINADPSQMEQVLLNLAGNAVDAMPDDGKILIETRNIVLGEKPVKEIEEAPAGDYVLLTFSDNGHGMNKETVERIFEPFYTTKAVGKGTGLGLASVYGIIRSHGGYITCFSEVGRGATFKIYLPALSGDADKAKKDFQSTPLKGGPETILIVDDEDLVRDFASRALRKFGYKVLAAAGGEEALELYTKRSAELQLVIMDIGMPGMGGLNCIRAILNINPRAKIIAASSCRFSSQVKKATMAGAAAHVGKPYNLKQLLEQVRNVLDGSDF